MLIWICIGVGKKACILYFMVCVVYNFVIDKTSLQGEKKMKNSIHGVAIVGFGGMGSHHAKLIQGLERMSIAGIFDILESRQEAAEKEGLFAYDSLEQVLTDSKVDIVLIATPNHVHKDIAIEAMKAGKNVICEKPVTLNSVELSEIMEASEKYERLFVVHQNRRWDEDFRVVKKLYDEKALGGIFHFESRVQGSRGIPGDWRKVKQYGGGMMLDWGVHLIDQLFFMVKEKVKKVYCQLSYALNQEVDDGLRLFITFESGKTAYIEVGTCNYEVLPRWYVLGTDGSALISDWDLSGRITKLSTYEYSEAKPIVTAAGLTKTMAPRDETTTYHEEIPRMTLDVCDFYRNVMDTLEGKTEIIVKNEEVMRVMKLMEAAFKSHELGQAVDFE